MSVVIELFGHSANEKQDWKRVVREQHCPFIGKKCYKTRKSSPEIAIGSCSVNYGGQPVAICPGRLLERRQVFTDCLHLFTLHEPGNELHIVTEVSIPGGSLDYMLVSAKGGKVRDFVGIEFQTLDTTGSVWPERQRLLKELGVPRADKAEEAKTPFGMNWKMTAKTILVQMHHKIMTFEHLHKKLALVIQDRLFAYMSKEFNFEHLSHPAVIGDPMHIHSYQMHPEADNSFKLQLADRYSTDSAGIAKCLGLRAEAKIELESVITTLQARISKATLFIPV